MSPEDSEAYLSRLLLLAITGMGRARNARAHALTTKAQAFTAGVAQHHVSDNESVYRRLVASVLEGTQGRPVVISPGSRPAAGWSIGGRRGGVFRSNEQGPEIVHSAECLSFCVGRGEAVQASGSPNRPLCNIVNSMIHHSESKYFGDVGESKSQV